MAYFFTSFYLYSFIGFILETVFALIVRGKLENRKTMRLMPLCPVYGIGALLMKICLVPFSFSPIIVLLLGMICGSVTEYIFGYLCLKIFNVRIWDYSRDKHNCKGVICLPFTAIWGVMSLIFIYMVNPYMSRIIMLFPESITIFLAIIFIFDFVLTIKMLKNIGRGEYSQEFNCPVITKPVS